MEMWVKKGFKIYTLPKENNMMPYLNAITNPDAKVLTMDRRISNV
jgi:hypothetical protein